MNHPVVIAWLSDAATLIAAFLLAASAAYGLLLLLAPPLALRATALLNRRLDLPGIHSLDAPRSSERFFYRHHRLLGVLLLAAVGAFFLLYAFDYPRDTVLARLAARVGGAAANAALQTAERFFIAMNLLVGAFAVVVVTRPSLLKPLEAVLNRWFSLGTTLRDADEPRLPLDRFVGRYPRFSGAAVLAGTAYVLAGFLIAL